MLTVLRRADTDPINSCFLATARSCVALLIERYNPGCAVLPMLCPHGLYDPFERAGVPIAWYDLNADLSPRFDAVSIKHRRPIVVVVHWCGYAMPLDAAKRIAAATGGILLEDCAQALVGPASDAAIGDVALYSLDKFLPVVGGGFMWSRHARIDLDLVCEPSAELPTEAVIAAQLHLRSNAAIAASGSREWTTAAMNSSRVHYDVYYRHISSDLTPRACLPQTRDAFMRAMREKMTRHRAAMSTLWPQNSRHLYRNGECAFALPVRTFGKRERVLDALLDIGVIASYWQDKWLRPPRDSCAREIMQDHVLLPIDEAVTAGKLLEMHHVLVEKATQ